MGKLADLRAALAGALDDITGVEKKAYIHKKVAVTTLSVVPAPDTPIVFDSTFGRGSDEYAFHIEALTPLNDFETAQKKLDELIGPYGDQSVKQALEASTDPLLAKKVRVTGVERYGVRPMPEGGGLMLGAQILVTVMASGKAPS